jgi:hypothetical protein
MATAAENSSSASNLMRLGIGERGMAPPPAPQFEQAPPPTIDPPTR